MTRENDVVLIYLEDQPLLFARIESIAADHKKDWYQVGLLLLQMPLQVVTWILREAYINGQEFTMNGKRMRLEKISTPFLAVVEESSVKETKKKERSSTPSPKPIKSSKVISLADRKPAG